MEGGMMKLKLPQSYIDGLDKLHLSDKWLRLKRYREWLESHKPHNKAIMNGIVSKNGKNG